MRRWIWYSGGALGLGIASAWLYRHSRLNGSGDLDQWVKEGVDATSGFLEEHVQQPVLFFSITLYCMFRSDWACLCLNSCHLVRS